MGVLAQLLFPFILVAVLLVGAKIVWMSGFTAGTIREAKLWLESLDKLTVPNWQSLPATGDDKTLTPEQSKFANRVYVSAYALALSAIKMELAEARRVAVEKAKAEEERQQRRFSA